MRTRIQTFELDPRTAAIFAARYDEVKAIIRGYAERYIENGRYHGDTVRDAAEQCALDMKGIDEPFEIKKQFRAEVRRLERLSRGGW